MEATTGPTTVQKLALETVDHQLGPGAITVLLAMVAAAPVDFLLVTSTGMMKIVITRIASKTLYQMEIMTVILEFNTAAGVMAVLV